jgi:hypothetical protein
MSIFTLELIEQDSDDINLLNSELKLILNTYIDKMTNNTIIDTVSKNTEDLHYINCDTCEIVSYNIINK